MVTVRRVGTLRALPALALLFWYMRRARAQQPRASQRLRLE